MVKSEIWLIFIFFDHCTNAPVDFFRVRKRENNALVEKIMWRKKTVKSKIIQGGELQKFKDDLRFQIALRQVMQSTVGQVQNPEDEFNEVGKNVKRSD